MASPRLAASPESGAAPNLVVVTGLPRSGTTVVGEVLGYARHAKVLHEPMNLETGDRAILRAYELPGTDGISEGEFERLVARVAALQVNFRYGFYEREPAWRKALKPFWGSRSTRSQRRAWLGQTEHIIWKDPFAMLAGPAIQRAAPGASVVVCYRPALPTAASFKRMNWVFDRQALQARLGSADLAAALPKEVDPGSPAMCGAMMWALNYRHVLLDTPFSQAEHRHLVTLDAIIEDPVGSYRDLFGKCGLDFSSDVEARVIERYRPVETELDLDRRTAHVRERNTSSINLDWKRILTDQEVEAIQALCLPIEQAIAARHLNHEASASTENRV